MTITDTIVSGQDQGILTVSSRPGTVPKVLAPQSKRLRVKSDVNSKYDEVNPILSDDGSLIFFARKRSPQNIGGSDDSQDLWMAKRNEDGSWGDCVHLGAEVNTERADNLTGISAGNDQFFFYRAARGNVGYFTTKKFNGTRWGRTKPIGLEIINESRFLESSLSLNGSVILFTAKNCNNVNYQSDVDERDIYISCKNKNGKWSRPINLGPAINTGSDEYSPFLSRDGSTLYFATKGRAGYGNADIFISHRIGNGWTNWTEPVNLGPNINTPSFDAYFSINGQGNTGYFISHNETKGLGDIFEIDLPKEFQPINRSNPLGSARVHFDEGEFLLKPEALPELNNVLQALRENKGLRIEIGGHTDSNGSQDALYKLGKARARTVRNYLHSNGISRDRLIIKSHGAAHPFTNNSTEENKSQNRRVEIRIATD